LVESAWLPRCRPLAHFPQAPLSREEINLSSPGFLPLEPLLHVFKVIFVEIVCVLLLLVLVNVDLWITLHVRIWIDLEGEEGEELGEEAFVHVLVHLVQEEPVPDAAVPYVVLDMFDVLVVGEVFVHCHLHHEVAHVAGEDLNATKQHPVNRCNNQYHVEIPTERKNLVIDHIESQDTNSVAGLLSSTTVVPVHHTIPNSGEDLTHGIEGAVHVPNLWRQPVVIEDVDAIIIELIGEESIGDKELADRYDNVEQLTGKEDVGVSVELVVHELEEVG